MRILKWLFHPINLFVIVILVALYINRQTLFPELSESPEVKQLTSRVDSVIDTLNETVSSLAEQGDADNVEPQESDSITVTADAAAVTAESNTQEAVDDVPQMSAVDPQDIPPQQDQGGVFGKKEQPITGENDATEQGTVTAEGAAATTQSNASPDPIDIWESARRAAWEGDSDSAIQQYRSLIAMQPGNFDAYGELGNVLLRKGDRAAAVDAYSQAAMLLSKSRYPQGAWRVLDIVSRLDQQKAQELYEALRRQQLGARQPAQAQMN